MIATAQVLRTGLLTVVGRNCASLERISVRMLLLPSEAVLPSTSGNVTPVYPSRIGITRMIIASPSPTGDNAWIKQIISKPTAAACRPGAAQTSTLTRSGPLNRRLLRFSLLLPTHPLDLMPTIFTTGTLRLCLSFILQHPSPPPLCHQSCISFLVSSLYLVSPHPA